MAIHLRCSTRLSAVALLFIVLQVSNQGLEYDLREDRVATPVTSDGRQVEVRLGRVGGEERITAVVRRGAGSSSPLACEWRVVRIPNLEAIALIDVNQMPPADAVAVRLMCGSAVFDQFWYVPADVVDFGEMARREAERYVQTILGPSLSVGANPPANVLVGLATWFWLDGWDGSDIRVGPIAPFDDVVDVELSLGSVTWHFGDGHSQHDAGLGLVFPQESSVQHVYTHRSTSRSDPDGAYLVSAEVTIDVRYWFNGEGPFSVAPLVHTHTSPLVVRQLQAVLSR